MTVYPTSKLHLPETLSNFKTMSMPFRNGNKLGWCSSILWRVKAFVSPANRNLSLPLNYIIHERDLGESQICLVSGTQCRQQAQLEHPFHVYAVEKANATLTFLGPRRPLWDPSLNTHLLFGINIKKPKKKKKKNEHTRRSSARFVWNLWTQSKCESPFILNRIIIIK